MGLGTNVWVTGTACACAQPFSGIVTNGYQEWCTVCGYQGPYKGDEYNPFLFEESDALGKQDHRAQNRLRNPVRHDRGASGKTD